MDKDAADTCALSSEQKLQVIRLLIDAKLNHADVQQFIEEVRVQLPATRKEETGNLSRSDELPMSGNPNEI